MGHDDQWRTVSTKPFTLDKSHPIWYAMAGAFEEAVDTARLHGNALTSEDYVKMEAIRNRMFRICQMSFAAGAQAIHDDVNTEWFNRGIRIEPWHNMLLNLNEERKDGSDA